jgi:hypothetical protein
MLVEGCWDNAVAKCQDLGASQSSPLGVTQMENMLTVHKYNPCVPSMSIQNAFQYHVFNFQRDTMITSA